jgi:hypothetical protein
MPPPLEYRRSRSLPLPVQLAVMAIWLLPLAGLALLWYREGTLYLEERTANLLLHGALLLVPVAWAGSLLAHPIRFRRSAETELGRTTFFDTLDADWWQSVMMWPAPAFALGLLAERAHQALGDLGPPLASTAPEILLLWSVTFGLAFFWGTAFMDHAPVRVSEEGLRMTNLHFLEWAALHRVVQRGDRFSVYHRVNPALPFGSFRLRDETSRGELLSRLSRHGVTQSPGPPGVLLAVRVLVALLAVLQLVGSAWLSRQASGNRLWIVVLVFTAGLLCTLVLERYRGIGRVTQVRPVIEPDGEGPSRGD